MLDNVLQLSACMIIIVDWSSQILSTSAVNHSRTIVLENGRLEENLSLLYRESFVSNFAHWGELLRISLQFGRSCFSFATSASSQQPGSRERPGKVQSSAVGKFATCISEIKMPTQFGVPSTGGATEGHARTPAGFIEPPAIGPLIWVLIMRGRGPLRRARHLWRWRDCLQVMVAGGRRWWCTSLVRIPLERWQGRRCSSAGKCSGSGG